MRGFKSAIGKGFFLFSTGIFLIGLNLFPLRARTQEIKTLTLQQSIELSIKNSHQLKASLAKNDEAAAVLRQAMDGRLPNASASATYMQLNNPTVALKSRSSSVAPDTTGNKTAFPKINQAMYGIVNVSVPVFTGGRIKYGIESAKFLQQAASLDAENDREAVVLNTINAYINLYKASVTVDVVKENLKQSIAQDSVFSRLEQNGLLARNDLLKSELQTSNIELSLLDAQSNLKTATVNMNLMIGYPESTLLKTDSTEFNSVPQMKTIDEYEQLALVNRKDLGALTFRRKAAALGIAATKAELYPTLALTGGYIAADIPKVLTITNALNIGVGLQYNISSLWKTKAKIQQANSKEKEIMENEAQLTDAIKLQVNRDFENVLLSQKKTEVFKKAVVQAEENFRITKNKYDNALVNTTDLLDANVALLQSKINLAVARADVLLAYSKLLETSGILIENKF